MQNTRKEQEIKKAAKGFAEYWKGKGYEKGESQKFWIELLSQVYGVEKPSHYVTFEEQVKLDHTSFIDVMIPSTHVMIEQKSIDKDLRKGIKQSDGSVLTPFQQAKRYSSELPYSQRPRWIVTCNFKEFLVYDMENPNGEPESILLEDLPKEYYRLNFLVDTKDENIKREEEISIQAGEIVGKLYDALRKQYANPDNEDSQKSLNVLCVRLVFCFYAEDADVFGKHLMFHDYLKQFDTRNFRRALIDVFRVLNTKIEDRDPYMDDELAAFPYVNGGLFADDNIEIPQFTDEIIKLILENASADFDWSEISPTIFGAVFESTLNPETRRSGGMHYTSVENIHKVIDPLFLDDLKAELEEIKELKQIKTRNSRLDEFCEKLSGLKFLDPACGSGNFLTETYLSLRKLENEAIGLRNQDQIVLDSGDIIKVKIDQFYGIEINDFAVTVAKTALWIAESQMMKQTEDIVHTNIDFLPLTTNAYIVEGNALRIDWNDVVPASELNYIMGNPPFVGARLMSKEQKEDLLGVFGKEWKNAGNLDYVSCWYKKSADYMKETSVFAALVSTNSVSQGESVANLWKPLFENGIVFNFAHRTFRWDSEANIKAHVHCVIIGFSYVEKQSKRLFESDNYKIVDNINGYLLNANNVFAESRNKPICDVPQIGIGNKPIDGGNYLFTPDEKAEFVKKEPLSEKYFMPWYGSTEFINNKPRYCLWIGDCPPNELRKMPECMKRVQAVRDYRLQSPSAGTRKIADTPTRFHVENFPKNTYIIIPETSSERRKYIPMGFMKPTSLCSNAVRILPNATLYHLGILESNVHMAWMRAVAGRLKSDYRYSKDIVYNNFPWCNPTDEQKAKIEQTAQAILDARAKYPDCSLADLYDELTMPSELRKAHQENDKAVMQAYGFDWRNMTESECVAELMKMYQALVEEK
ncbi:MAG: class I SAM-dependent DNA methyltransferase [Ruminococcaceae bacterium]|nr:class I SAM-dependent DNA methyltransferase [Oscillospiraceae bacterium]